MKSLKSLIATGILASSLAFSGNASYGQTDENITIYKNKESNDTTDIYVHTERDGWESHCWYVNKKGKKVIPTNYDDCLNFNEGVAVVKKINGKYGFIDPEGKSLTPFKYDYANSMKRGFSTVSLNERYGFVKKVSDTIIEIDSIKYDAVTDFDENNVALAIYNGKCGIIDDKGNLVVPFEYKRIEKDDKSTYNLYRTQYSSPDVLFMHDYLKKKAKEEKNLKKKVISYWDEIVKDTSEYSIMRNKFTKKCRELHSRRNEIKDFELKTSDLNESYFEESEKLIVKMHKDINSFWAYGKQYESKSPKKIKKLSKHIHPLKNKSIDSLASDLAEYFDKEVNFECSYESKK